MRYRLNSLDVLYLSATGLENTHVRLILAPEELLMALVARVDFKFQIPTTWNQICPRSAGGACRRGGDLQLNARFVLAQFSRPRLQLEAPKP